MLIVPEADFLAVEAKVSPQDIDQLHVGQLAGLRFSAFNERTTPEITGTITRISADVAAIRAGPKLLYRSNLHIADQVARLGKVRLMPGMPVEGSSRPTIVASSHTSPSRYKTRSCARFANGDRVV